MAGKDQAKNTKDNKPAAKQPAKEAAPTKNTQPAKKKHIPMSLFSNIMPRIHRHNSLPTPPDTSQVYFMYMGGSLDIDLQRSKSKWLNKMGPTRLIWNKAEKNLGLTFTENAETHEIVIKSCNRFPMDVSLGQALIAVNDINVKGMDFDTVKSILMQSQSPCQLEFSPPPSPILVKAVKSHAANKGISIDMVLKSISGRSMIGADLQDVRYALESASIEQPAILEFVPLSSVIHSDIGTKQSRRLSTINNICLGMVAAALASNAT